MCGNRSILDKRPHAKSCTVYLKEKNKKYYACFKLKSKTGPREISPRQLEALLIPLWEKTSNTSGGNRFRENLQLLVYERASLRR